MSKSTNSTLAEIIVGLMIVITIGLAAVIVYQYFIMSDRGYAWSGTLGDSLAGITGPIISLGGAVLVYLALREQVLANELVQQQMSDEHETQNLNQLYSYLEHSLKEFSFHTLPEHWLLDDVDLDALANGIVVDGKRVELPRDHYEVATGYAAIERLLSQIYCSHKLYDEDFNTIRGIVTLTNILMVMDDLLSKIEKSNASNAPIISSLVSILYSEYISVWWGNEGIIKLDRRLCKSCNREHGFPENLIRVINSINNKVSKKELV